MLEFVVLQLLFPYAFFAAHDGASYPPLPEQAALARIAPDECIYYACWSGRAEPDPTSKNRTERLLAEPEIQAFFSAVGTSVRALPIKDGNDGVYELVALCYSRPKACFIHSFRVGFGEAEERAEKRADGEIDDPGAAGGSFDTPEGRDLSELFHFDGAIVVFLGDDAAKGEELLVGIQRAENRVAGTTRTIESVPFSAWNKEKSDPVLLANYEGYLILACGDAAAKNVALGLTEKRGPPAWLTTIRKRAPVARLSTLSYANVAKVVQAFSSFAVGELWEPKTPAWDQFLAVTGLKNMATVATVSGLDGDAMLSRTLIDFDGPATGVFSAIPNQPLSADDFRDIPFEAKHLAVGRYDVSALTDEFGKAGELFATAASWDVAAQVAIGYRLLEAQTGINFASDLIGPLGQRWAYYGLDKSESVSVVPLRDMPRFRTTLDTLRVSLDKEKKGYDKRTVAGREVVMSEDGKGGTCLLNDRFLFASNLKLLEQYVSRPANMKSAAEKPAIAAILSRKVVPVIVSYDEAHTNFVETYLTARKGLAKLGGFLTLNGVAFDAGTIPSRHVIEKHLTPSSWIVTRTERGLEIESRGTLPIAKLHLLAALGNTFLPDASETGGAAKSEPIPGTVLPSPIPGTEIPIPGPVSGNPEQ